MDQVIAEELLLQYDVLVAASSSVKSRVRRQILERLRKAATRGKRAKPATPAVLATMGIGVRLVRPGQSA